MKRNQPDGRKPFTPRFLDALKPLSKPYCRWDLSTTGLGIKVTPAGRKIFVLNLRFPGRAQQTKRTLGQYPARSLAEARDRAREWHKLKQNGVDPADKAREAGEAARRQRMLDASNTFGAVAEAYIAVRRGVKRRAAADEREIRRTLLAKWGSRPIASITQQQVDGYMSELAKRTPYEAKNAWVHAMGIFKLAVRGILIDGERVPVMAGSPMLLLKRRDVFANAKTKPRDRTLTDDEVRALWHCSFKLPWPHGHLYRWLLMSGCRLDEALGAVWQEFHPELRRALRDLVPRNGAASWATMPADHKTWVVPPERFKSEAAHEVPVTDAMCELLADVPMRGPFVFSHTGNGKLWSNSLVKRQLNDLMLDYLRELARERGDNPRDVKLPRFTAHDLRRVVRSNVGKLDVPENICELVMGHGKKGLARVYDRERYLPQIRDALNRWHQHLAELVS